MFLLLSFYCFKFLMFIYIYIYIYIDIKKLLLIIQKAFVHILVNFFSCALT